MKKFWLISILLGVGLSYVFSQDSIVSIPDTAFLNALIEEGVDTNGDGKISYAEAEAVTELIVSSNGISSLEGIQAFTHLAIISVDNNQLSSLDFTNNTALSGISCQDNQLTNLNVSNNTALTTLDCDGNALTSLDVSTNKALWRLQCYDNLLFSLDVSYNSNIENLFCYNNQLSSLDVSKNTALTALFCDDNALTSLDISKNIHLESLYCSGNQLINLDVSNNTDLRRLACENNQITKIDVSNNISLTHLHLSGNQLIVLDISNNINLDEPFGPWGEVSLSIADMPSLTQVCVWEEFLSDQFSNYDTIGSPNVYFTTECENKCLEGKFTDARDGIEYSYVTIGNQVWMAENLKYLPSVVGPDSDSHITTPYYYVYGYDGTDIATAKATANYNTFGVLYNWLAAMQSSVSSNDNPSGVQGVCPPGWHLPSDAEWTDLIEYLGGESVAGDKLKETGTSHWKPSNTMATNESGFTALPGGWRNGNNYNIFEDLGVKGSWWSATEAHSTYARYRVVEEGTSDVFNYSDGKNDGCSVRCLRDDSPAFILDEETQLFTFYPNPTNSFLTIETGISGLYDIEVTSLNGKLILSKEMEGTTHQFDLSSFQKGVYFITIKSEDFLTTRKIIKL